MNEKRKEETKKREGGRKINRKDMMSDGKKKEEKNPKGATKDLTWWIPCHRILPLSLRVC